MRSIAHRPRVSELLVGWRLGLRQRLPYISRGDEYSKDCTMNEYAILAFVITPALVIALGWGAVFLFEHYERRRQLHPGE